jgi:uncharacterized membrane protein
VLGIGATLVTVGLTRRNLTGYIIAGFGVAALIRGAQGYKRLYQLVGKEVSKEPVVLPPRAVKIEEEIIVARSPEDLYAFWRDPQNLPKVLSHVRSVEDLGNGRSRWVADAPLGTVVEWDSEIINDVPNEIIAWRSLEGSDVDNAGSVHFNSAGGLSTRLKVVIRYTPPGDVAGVALAKMFGVDPAKEVREDLERFKREMEAQAGLGSGVGDQ